MLSNNLKDKVLEFQRNEITEHFVYKILSNIAKDKQEKDILNRLSQEELSHYEFFRTITKEKASFDKFRILFYSFISRIFGLNFGLKLMERGEGLAQDGYKELKGISPELEKIIQEEDEHEQKLISLIDEDRLKYISSIFLGMNDAVIEFISALAGFTLALQNNKIIAGVGLITGIAASLSMGCSEYLATKQEDSDKKPLKAGIYTGAFYLGTVLLFILPYIFFKNIFFCLFLILSSAIFLIFIFTFYISIAKGLSFKKRFSEITAISLSIAGINFLLGLVIKRLLRIDV
ncbi:MAG: VIT1/CCC1 family protein [Candidatus Omnitrophica bacterium]|nr:VIT1/CCC1 family protein [Candidatus Omnitrophota bacterium]